MKKNWIYIPLMVLASCTSNTESGGHHAHGEEHHEGDDKTVSITVEQAKSIGLKTGYLEQQNMGATVLTTGELTVPPQGMAQVSMPLGGIIKKINVIEGQYVKKGQVLAVAFDPQYIKMQEEYLTDYSNYEFALKDLERKRALYQEKGVSERELQNAENKMKVNWAKAEAKAALLNLIGINVEQLRKGDIIAEVTIKAPIEGFITEVDARIGKHTEASAELFDIMNNEHLHADLRVFEKDIYKVKEGQRVVFTTQGLPDKEFSARIFSVGKNFEDSPKTVHLHAEIENRYNELLPGSYLEGRIEIDSLVVTAVSEHALVTEGERHFIFTKSTEDEGGHEHGHNHEGHDHVGHVEKLSFTMLEVVKGRTIGKMVEITPIRKLSSKEEIVTYGAYYLQAELGKANTAHTH